MVKQLFLIRKLKNIDGNSVEHLSKLMSHLESVHRNEQEVKALKLIPKAKRMRGNTLSSSQKERLKMINLIRNQGNFEDNRKAGMHDDFLVSRRPQQRKPPKTVADYLPCPKCKGMYENKSLHKHVARCTKKSSKHNHNVHSMANKTLGNFHNESSDYI